MRGLQRGLQIASVEPDGAQQKQRRIGIKLIKAKVHGDPLGEKQDHHVRLVFESFNGLAPWYVRNDKIVLARRFLHRIKADGYLGTECRAQWDILRHSNKLEQLFKSEVQIKAVSAHNIHEDDTRAQEGGTAIIAFDQLASLVKTSGVDPSGLGRWSWVKILGKHSQVTRIICAYQPCTSKRTALSSVGAQHRRYYRARGIKSCPRLMFRKDLTAQLGKWMKAKERILLFIDANEDLSNGPLIKILTKMKLRDLIKERTNMPGPPTHFTGKHQIDGVFASVDIECGGARFLPFWVGIGDHRAIVVDIPQQVLYGEQLLRIIRPKGRKLQCRQERVKDKYLTKLRIQTRRHKLEEKLQRLSTMVTYPCSEYFDFLQNQIDTVQRDVMRSAESKCRKWHMGEVDYSPTIMIWWHRRLVWKLLIKWHSGFKISTTLIERKARSCGIEDPFHGTALEAHTAYNICRDQFNLMKPKAAIYRRDFIRQRIKEYKSKGDMVAVYNLKLQQQREKSVTDWRRINSAWATRSGGCVTKVSIKTNNNVVELTSQIPIEDAIMDNNDRRFKLPYGTSLLNDSTLHQELGLLSTTEAAEQILSGTYKYKDDVDPETIRVLNVFAQVFKGNREMNFDQGISGEDYRNYWYGRKEKTSSSYSRLHFGHWIACADSPYLSSLLAKKIELSFRSGSPLKRWLSGLSVMLEKVAGVNLVDKLRAILLMEADFNFANALYFGKRTMEMAKKSDIITNDTFGSKQDSCPIEVPMCRMLFFDLVRQTRRNASLGSFDAQSCYDRIAHSFLSLVAQAVGTPQPLIITMLKAIQQMKLFLRTGYGDSDRHYCSTDKKRPYQGSVQGNGAAPCLWLLISSFLLRYMKQAGHFLNIRSAITATNLVYTALMFVDDSDFPIYAQSVTESIQSIAQRQQETVNSWSHGLRVSGGSLKPEKCFWYPIEWTWKNGAAKATKSKDVLHEIIVEGPDGVSSAIPKLDYDHAREILGVFQAPSGQIKSEITKLETIRDKYIPVLSNHYLPQELVWISFWGKLWPSLTYPLPALSLSEAQADEFMIPLYKNLLPSLKISRSFPKVYRYSIAKYGGAGLPNLFIEQTIAMLSLLVMHGDATTLTGQHLRHSMEALQLEVGMSTHFLHLPYSKYGTFTTFCWLSDLWQHISNLPIKIIYRRPEFLKLQRTGDRFLMDIVHILGHTSVQFLRSFNKVRLYYKCYSLADIVTGTGLSIRKSVKQRRPSTVVSSFEWPRVQPNAYDIMIWEDTLDSVLLYMRQNNIVLGDWMASTHVKPTCLYHQPTATVYILQYNQWRSYTQAVGRPSRHYQIYNYAMMCDPPTTNCQRGTYAQTDSRTIHFEGSSGTQLQPVHTPITLREILEEWGDMWIWEHINLMNEGEWLATAITNKSALLVCDGSYQPDLTDIRGSAAWTIECRNSKQRIMGVIPSTTTTANAYRAELTGLYVSMTYVLAVCLRHKIEHGQVEIGCDNEQGLYLSSILNDRVATKMKHSDVIRAIRKVRCSIPVNLVFTHIYGHQDDGKDYLDLDRMAQLNVDCDKLAKTALRRHNRLNKAIQDNLPHEVFVCHIKSAKITGDIGVPLRDEVSRLSMRKFLNSKGRLSLQGFDLVDWNAMQHKMKTTPTHHRIWISKHLSGFCSINKRRNMWDKTHPTMCPCCKDPGIVEDTRHLMHCTDPIREELWADSVTELKQWLTESQTNPQLISAIISYVSNRGETSFTTIASSSPTLRTLANDQDVIGWDNFMEGRIAITLGVFQEAYYKSNESRSSSLKWSSDLISHLIIMIRTQWLHRNSVVHKRRKDGLKIEEGKKISTQIYEALETGARDLDTVDHYLLDYSIEQIDEWTGAKKKIWLRSMTAAKNLK